MSEGGIPVEESQSHQVSEGEVKPPKNVKIGLLFQPHAIESKKEIAPTKKKLKTFFTRTFSKDKKNIYLAEDAYSDEQGQNFRDNCEEGFERYGSFRAAAVYAQLKETFEKMQENERQEGKTIKLQGLSVTDVPTLDKDIHKIMAEKEQEVLHNPSNHPEASYTWVKYQVLDELIADGYDIKRVYEEGADKRVAWQGKWSFFQYQEEMQKIAQHLIKRNGQIQNKIVSLVETAEKQSDDTNIAGVFGTNHRIIVDDLPERIKAIIDLSGSSPIEDNPENRVEFLLVGGTPVSEIPHELWRAASEWSARPIKQVSTIRRLTHKFKRK